MLYIYLKLFKKSMKKSLQFLFIFYSNFALAITNNVPSMYPSISAALIASQAGDTILVAPGTYLENIVWPQTPSLKLFGSAGSSATIIDGNALGSVLKIKADSIGIIDTTTIISGFQIMNGFVDSVFGIGGGVFIQNASPFLTDLDIHHNSVRSDDWAYGAGICCFMEAHPLIYQCNIYNNTISSNDFAKGGGIYIGSYSSVILRHCNIYDNSIVSARNGSGGGIGIGYSENGITISDCNFYNNQVAASIFAAGGGVSINGTELLTMVNCNISINSVEGEYSDGGGIDISSDSTFTILQSTISENVSLGVAHHAGAGINCYGSSGLISNCEISNNKHFGVSLFEGTGISLSASNVAMNNTIIKFNEVVPDTSYGSEVRGVALIADNSVLNMRNCLVVSNSCYAKSNYPFLGTIIHSENSTINISHSTISDSIINLDSLPFGIAFSSNNSTLNFKNSIFWNADCFSERTITVGSLSNINFCDIRNASLTNGNINSDPLFVSPNDYHLSMLSPCLNAGIVSVVVPYDLDSVMRPLPIGTSPDMGAYETDQPVGVISFEKNNQSSVFPNPVDAESLISLRDLNDRIVQVEIYNGLGQIVISKSGLSSNTYNLNSVNLKSGVYLYQLTTRSGEILKGKFVVN